MPSTTYEIIKALPGKGFNWTGFVAELRARYVVTYSNVHDGALPWEGTLAEWDAAKGVRQLRHTAMYISTCLTDTVSKRSSFIPPSPETLAWGGFLGGETVVYTDREAEAIAIEEVRTIAAFYLASV